MKVSHKGYLTVGEFAYAVGVSESTVRRRIHDGSLSFIRLRCLYCDRSRKCGYRAQKLCKKVIHVAEVGGLKVGFTR